MARHGRGTRVERPGYVMVDFSCWGRSPGPPESLLLADGFPLMLAAILLLALSGSALAAPLVQRAYRRRIVRLMRFNQVAPRPSQWWSSKTSGGYESSSPAAVGSKPGGSGTPLLDLVSGRERRVAVSTTLAWGVFVLLALPVSQWVLADGSASDHAYFAVGAGALALGPAYVNLPPRFARWALVLGCALAAVLIVSLVTTDAATPGDSEDPDVLETIMGGVIVALAYLSMFPRRLRGLVLPVSVVAAVALVLLLVPYGYLEPHVGACFAEATTPGASAVSAPYFLLGNTMVALALWLGLKALDGLAHLVEKGWLSELSLISGASLSMIALALVASSVSEQSASSAWLAWLALPWAGAAVATYALTLGRHAPGPGPRLLMLRVFARQRKQLKLLDELQSRWRYAGPVHQIGGPDLATTNVDPHDCALFLVGRLHDLFLPTPTSPALLSSRLQGEPDREGRYRIGEVFCFNSAWQQTVEQLMRISDAILLDVRGLTAERKGTSYELCVLARAGLLDRVVAVGDEHTDWALADALLVEEGQDPKSLARRIGGPELRAPVIFDQLLRVANRTTSPI
jgi:hypothetical protein